MIVEAEKSQNSQLVFNDICRKAKRIHGSGSLAASHFFYQVLGIPESPKQADEPQQQSKKRDPFQVKQVFFIEKKVSYLQNRFLSNMLSVLSTLILC